MFYFTYPKIPQIQVHVYKRSYEPLLSRLNEPNIILVKSSCNHSL